MSHFDIMDSRNRDLRRCQTHAFAARLFARYPMHPSNSDIWAEVARSWDELARLKAQIALSDSRTAHFNWQG